MMSRRCGLKKGIIPHQRESLTYQYWSDNGFPIQMSGMSGIMARARRKLMFTLKFESETAENKTKRNEIFMRQRILHPKTSNLAMQREIQKWGQGERTRGEIDSQRERERDREERDWPKKSHGQIIWPPIDTPVKSSRYEKPRAIRQIRDTPSHLKIVA